MAKKDNSLLWLAALGIGGYLFWQNNKNKAAATVTTTANASTGTLLLNPSPAINTAKPVANAPVSSSPISFAVNTTGLVPAAVTADNVPVLQPGQSVALLPNGLPVQNNAGNPLVFPSANPMAVVVDANGVPKKVLLSGAIGDCQ